MQICIYYIEDGDVRLVDGPKPSEGRFEMWYNNTWNSLYSSYYYTTIFIIIALKFLKILLLWI